MPPRLILVFATALLAPLASAAEHRVSAIPQKSRGRSFRSVLPLLVETPSAYVAVAESDILNWARLFLTGTGESAVRAELAPRQDKRGAVVGRIPMASPWRVLMVGRTAAELIANDLCDSPANHRGQAGVEFFRDLPTVWDESVVLSAEVGKHLVIARRSGQRWFIAAMNGDDALSLDVSLAALDLKGRGWQLREFADGADPAAPETVVETTRDIGKARTLTLRLVPGGGYAAILSPKPPAP